ncbi:MAG: hypothetical protein ACRDOI_04410 [Trebonia sp.]
MRPAHGFAFARLAYGDATIAQLTGHLGVTRQAAAQIVDGLSTMSAGGAVRGNAEQVVPKGEQAYSSTAVHAPMVSAMVASSARVHARPLSVSVIRWARASYG